MSGSSAAAHCGSPSTSRSTLPLMPVQAFGLALDSPLRPPASRVFYHRLCCRILGLRVRRQRHAAQRHRPTLFVSNHVSYLDITVLGALIRGPFVAKAEVAGWPLFGWLAKLQRTVFVDRRRAGSRASSATRSPTGSPPATI